MKDKTLKNHKAG